MPQPCPNNTTTITDFLRFDPALSSSLLAHEIRSFVHLYTGGSNGFPLHHFCRGRTVYVHRRFPFRTEQQNYSGYRAGNSNAEIVLFPSIERDLDKVVFSLVHEIGHAVDNLVFQHGLNDFASGRQTQSWFRINPEWSEWRAAVSRSELYKKYQTVAVIVQRQEEIDEIAYCLSWQELFACAYTQWVFLERNEPIEMEAAMRYFKTDCHLIRDGANSIRVARQWQSIDFERCGLLKAMQQLFR